MSMDTGDRVFAWKCPACFRVTDRRYRPDRPLPSCVGGPRPHPPQMLVCANEDVYRECFARYCDGAPMLKPLIHPRNYREFRCEPPGDPRQSFGQGVAR